jgi:hypothetical protein
MRKIARGRKVLKVPKVPKVLRVPKAHKVLRVRKAFRDRRDHQALRDLKVHKALRDHRVLLVRPATTQLPPIMRMDLSPSRMIREPSLHQTKPGL